MYDEYLIKKVERLEKEILLHRLKDHPYHSGLSYEEVDELYFNTPWKGVDTNEGIE